MQAAEAGQQQARKDADSAIAAREAELRADAESRLSQRVEEVRAEAHAQALAEAQSVVGRDQADAATARASERDARLAAVERLLASVRRIDAAATLRETLEVLVQSASLETPRVAVLLIEGDTVRAFSHRGFTDVPDAGPIAPGGVVEACVHDGQPAFTGDAAGLKAPGFAGLADDRAGFAAPLRVGTRTVAVLYADDASEGERDAPAAWPEALELLARHASIHLENLTAVRLNSSSSSSQFGPADGDGEVSEDAARRYARLLLSEIKLYHEGDVRLGREHRDLRRRLGSEIDRAAHAYRERIPETLAGRDQYFESELVNTLADGDVSIL
ncbi:MAG TPA: GAF domain-containing protein [Vicinamibacterales bacterium]|nr:GAF domain-containing protein [Vicinamibacterales bacterium]